MKRYKKDNFNFYVYNYDELIKKNILEDLIKLLRKKYKNINVSNLQPIYKNHKNHEYIKDEYVVIIKNKKLVGFLFGSIDMDFLVRRYVLNIKTQKDYLIIFSKLLEIYKYIQIKVELKNKNMLTSLKKMDFRKWDYAFSKNGHSIWLFSWEDPSLE